MGNLLSDTILPGVKIHILWKIFVKQQVISSSSVYQHEFYKLNNKHKSVSGSLHCCWLVFQQIPLHFVLTASTATVGAPSFLMVPRFSFVYCCTSNIYEEMLIHNAGKRMELLHCLSLSFRCGPTYTNSQTIKTAQSNLIYAAHLK